MSDADLLWQICKICIPIVGFALVLLRIGKIEKREIGPQPLRTKEDDTLMTVPMHEAACGPLHKRVDALEKDVRGLRFKMESDKAEIIRAGEDRAKAIHDRINVVIEKVGEMRGEIKHLSQKQS